MNGDMLLDLLTELKNEGKDLSKMEIVTVYYPKNSTPIKDVPDRFEFDVNTITLTNHRDFYERSGFIR
jgi:hypothetical protein